MTSARDSSKRFDFTALVAAATRWRLAILLIGLAALTAGAVSRL